MTERNRWSFAHGVHSAERIDLFARDCFVMFRKRDSDPFESENEADEELELEVEIEPELKPEPAPMPKPHFLVKPEPEPMALEEQPSVIVTPDEPPSRFDLPESEPLSAAPKTAATSISSAASPSSSAASPSPDGNKRLIVGQGIRLSGEINSCDRLVVEGEVEVTLNDTLALEITSSGRFTGGCEVEEADISGIYEGDLTVRNTLFVRGTGRITGTIRYGQLELERGGQIAGNISVLGNDGAGANDASKVRSAKTPLFGGSS